MGFKINFTVEGGDLIDDYIKPPVYTQTIKVTGNSISDSICFEQDGVFIGMNERQFVELVEKCLESSLFYKLKQDYRNGVK